LTVAFSSFDKAASLLAAADTQSISSWSMGLLGVLIGTALLFGTLTPVAGALAALSNLWGCVSWLLASGSGAHGSLVTAANLSSMSIVVLLLGPGAFSLDAYFFGRREIDIPKAPESPRS
jgi:uncharacterized membrane protein YphA (DoxX/SURF4 family)